MNAFVSRWVEVAPGAAETMSLLARLTLLLAVAWLVHAALTRANPRWRVLLWRGTAVAVVLMTMLALATPTISLAVLPPDNEKIADAKDATARPSLGEISNTGPEVSSFEQSPQFASPPISEPTPLATAPSGAQPTETQPTPVAASDSEPETSPAASAATAIARPWILASSLWLLWIAGVLVGVTGELIAHRRLVGLMRRARVAHETLVAEVTQVAARMDWHRSLRVLITTELDSPCVVGVWRPTILLPGTTERLDCDEDLQAVLAHEIQHLKNADLTWNALLRGIARLLWFHPLAWRIRAAHVEACDAVCDASAAQFLGDVPAYCRALARLALRANAPQPAAGLAMARASLARRRIEALHRRLDVARLPQTRKVMALAAGLVVAALLGTTTLTQAHSAGQDPAKPNTAAKPNEPPTEESARASGPTISGVVLNEHGQPITGATVQVHSAGVRIGTSPYCPTCYADCGKRVLTDQDGKFSIGSLDRSLVFQLLAVADGFRPEFVKKVDPAVDSKVEFKLSARPVPDDPQRMVRGQVIDPDGKPAVGAIVEPFGCQVQGRRWWGSMPGVDALAVTNGGGNFVLVTDKPVLGLDLRVEARGAARRNFALVKSGKDEHRLNLDAGTTVEGRIVRAGRGVPGVLVGVVQKGRGSEKFVGTFQIGTDAEGKFSLPNLPADEELTVYGMMDSLRPVGAVLSHGFKSAARATTNVGDLKVVKSCRLQGRLALTDGKPVPANTRVLFGRPEAWDSTFVEADAEGRFTIDGIPGERISIHVRLPGYRLSPKNQSFEPLNGTGLEGVVSGDIDNLIVLFEPGETLRHDYKDNAQWQRLAAIHQQLRTRPLAGVTAELETPPLPPGEPEVPDTKPSPVPYAPTTYSQLKAVKSAKIDLPPPRPAIPAADAGPKKAVAGVVNDAAGKPVPGARVWFPARWVSPFETLTVAARCDDHGRFQLEVPQGWLPEDVVKRNPILWAYAPGHAIGTVNAAPQLFGDKAAEPCMIALPAESAIAFVVTLEDGRAAVEAKIKPQHFRTPWAYDYVPRELAELITVTTDAEGRARLPFLTRESTYTVEIEFPGCGKQVFRTEFRVADANERAVELRPAGRIEGRIITDQLELVRDLFVSIKTTSLDDLSGLTKGTGEAMLKVGEDGRFVIPEIAEGALHVLAFGDDRVPVRPRLPKQYDSKLLAGETLRVDIPLEPTVRVRGVIRAKDTGQPIADATVSVHFGTGLQSQQVKTDEQGVYIADVLAGDVNMQIIHLPGGYTQLGASWKERHKVPADVKDHELPLIEVTPTTTVNGALVDADGKPMAGVKINGVIGGRRHGHGASDEAGKFSLPGVPVGMKLEKFEIWAGEAHLTGQAISTEPLIVRAQ